MTRHRLEPVDPASPDPDTPYFRALAAGTVAPLANATVGRLLDEMGARMTTDDVALELAALRIVLYRLLTEHHDLPSLATLVGRVVTVALQAARTSHHLRQQDAANLLDAITIVLQELADEH